MKFENLYKRMDGSDFKYNVGMTFIVVDDIENPEFKIVDRYKVGDINTYKIKQIDQYYDVINVREYELDDKLERENIVVRDRRG